MSLVRSRLDQVDRRLPRSDQGRIQSRHAQARAALPRPADTVAMAFSRRAQAGPIDVASHAGESITGDLMTKAW